MAQNIFGLVHTLMDNAGAIEVGGTIEVYDAGTTTPRTLYSDRTLSTTAGSTITADAAGRFPERWIADGVLIKLIYKDADGATLATRDHANDNSSFIPEDIDDAGLIRVVDTYAAMTALASDRLTDNCIVCTYGKVAENDGAFGLWRWDAGSSATTDGGTVLAHDTISPGRFIRQHDGIGRIEWWGGAVGDGTTDATAAIRLAAASGLIIDPLTTSSIYLMTAGVSASHYANGTVFRRVHFRAKTGSGGFTSTDNSADRYTTAKCMFVLNDYEGGGAFDNCKFSTNGGAEVVCTAVAIERGLETKPFLFRGVNEFDGFTGAVAAVSVNEAGAAGWFFDTIVMRNIGTTRSDTEGYWNTNTGFIQTTGLMIDNDVAGHYSKLIRGKKVICEDFFQTGQAWLEGPQVDGVTIVTNVAATNSGRDVQIDEVFCRNVPGEGIDTQGRGWRIGKLVAINCFTGYKAVHGAQGVIDHVHAESVGYAAVHINASTSITQDTKAHVGKVTGRNIGKYILNSGTAVSATSTTLVLAVGASALDDYYYKSAFASCIRITGGTGSGQEREITDYVGSTRTVTVASWGVTPDNTSTYEILLSSNRTVVAFSADDGTGTYTGHLNGTIIDNVEVEDDSSYTKYHVYSGMSATSYTNVVTLADPNAATGGDFSGSAGELPSVTIIHKNVGQTRVLASSFVGVDHTGSTAETTLATITVPANAMGRNGFVIIEPIWSWTENGNVKTVRAKFGGTTYGELTGDTALLESSQQYIKIGNRNATNSQVGFNGASSFAVSGSDKQTSSVDTESAVTILLTGQLASSGDTVTLEGYTVTVCYKA